METRDASPADRSVKPSPVRANPPATGKDDPQAVLIDSLSEEEALAILGPSWSEMSPAECARYGSTPAEPDPLFSVLETLGTDLAEQIEAETFPILHRCAEQLDQMERRCKEQAVAPAPILARYREVYQRIRREKGQRHA